MDPSAQSPKNPYAYQQPVAAVRKKGKAWPWILGIGLGCGAVVGLVAVLVGLGVLFELSADEVPLSADERGLLLDAEALARDTPDLGVDVANERAYKKQYFDKSYALEYEYEDSSLYLNYSINWEPKRSDAMAVYLPMWDSTRVGLQIGGGGELAVAERNDLFSWGDTSRFGILQANGEPYGNLFVARWKHDVVYLVLTGLYYDDTESLEALLGPYLDGLKERRRKGGSD
ncbi:MAG: hypothetical protein AAGD06_03325 [Acidobacteriota bacterium]